jgi:hypothetical protein
MRTSKAWFLWARLGSLALLSACTSLNPAYEDEGGDGTPGPTSQDDVSPETTTSSTDGPPVETSTNATSASTGSDASDENGEASTSETDTGPEEPLPPLIGAYHMPLLESALSDPNHEDDDPTLTGDMLEIYFATLRPGGPGMDDIWFSTRDDVEGPWNPPEPALGLNTPLRDHTPELSLDGLTMMLASTRDTFADEDVYMATRPTRDSPWEEPVRVDEMSTPVRDVCPFVTADGLETYGCMGAGLILEIVRFERGALGDPWSGAVPVEQLSSAGLDCGAWVDATKTTIAFFSDRPGMGGTDLWVATRRDVDEPFGMPVPLEGLDSPWLDDDPWMAQDGSVVYFASDRPGTQPQDIYVARRR